MTELARWVEGRPLASLTTWRVGGSALRYAEPRSAAEVQMHLREAEQAGLPWTIMGRGSNLLVADAGFEGLVVRLCESCHAVRVVLDERDAVVEALTAALGRPVAVPFILAEAGASSSALVKAAMEQGLGGLAFLSSIPGSVGGAVFMNAGAHGSQTSEVLLAARVLEADGTIVWRTPEQLAMSYRHCSVQDDGGVILEAAFKVVERSATEVRREVLEFAHWRRERQPQDPSAGSVFRNPPGDSAGRLIEATGLKGFGIGGAQVSPVHANFIVNTGRATARDINQLIVEVRDRVADRHGVLLHTEVRGLGLVVGQLEP